MKTHPILAGILAISALSSIVRADDVYLTWDGSRIHTGAISEDETTITPNVRVFSGILGDPDPFTANDPGMMAVPGTFQFGTSTGFEFLHAVRKWNGSSFGSSPSGDSFHVYLNSLVSDSPLTDVIAPGLSIPVDANGQWHHHPFWQIDAAATHGIYLVTVDAFNSATNLRSAPFWFVWDYEADPNNPVNDVDSAALWVNTTLVPAPGVAAISAPALALTLRRRRR